MICFWTRCTQKKTYGLFCFGAPSFKWIGIRKVVGYPHQFMLSLNLSNPLKNDQVIAWKRGDLEYLLNSNGSVQKTGTIQKDILTNFWNPGCLRLRKFFEVSPHTQFRSNHLISREPDTENGRDPIICNLIPRYCPFRVEIKSVLRNLNFNC